MEANTQFNPTQDEELEILKKNHFIIRKENSENIERIQILENDNNNLKEKYKELRNALNQELRIAEDNKKIISTLEKDNLMLKRRYDILLDLFRGLQALLETYINHI